MEIREAQRMGITAQVQSIDFEAILERARRLRLENQRSMRTAIVQARNLDYYEAEGYFTGDHTLEVRGQRIHSPRIFIAAGARPTLPSITGLESVPFLTSDTVFDLHAPPESLVIVGGGFIACEFAHFFEAVGTRVTIMQRNPHLLPGEEPEISELVHHKFTQRMQVLTNTEAVAVEPDGAGITLIGRDRHTGQLSRTGVQQLLVAAGRTSNADRLRAQVGGIELDARGFIMANNHLETNVPGIWAIGDILGKKMFKHSANREALYAWYNGHGHGEKYTMDYSAVPHAVFVYPEVASVGLTEAEAARTHKILVGRANYSSTAFGLSLVEQDGFVKAIVDARDERILGCHIVGPYAAMLLQEVVNAMAAGIDAGHLGMGLYTHPALNEVVANAFGSVQPAN